MEKSDELSIQGTPLKSRLILGTGKFASAEILANAIRSSQTSMVTVALRRVDLANPKDNLLAAIQNEDVILLPNTSGAQNAQEAVRLARLARAAGTGEWVKLEVTPDPRYLLPDGEETLKAAKILVDEGFKVMPYINADPLLARKLEEAGTASVMPLGSPIGTNQGLQTLEMLKIIIEQASVPVVVDAGIGKPSEAAHAMEIGADAVLVNTAIATAADPVLMAEGFRCAVSAGRSAYLAGLPQTSQYAEASSTLEWLSQL